MRLPVLFNEPGPLLLYLQKLIEIPGKDKDVSEVVSAVKTVLSTPEGRIMLELLEKSTKDRLPGILDDDRALAARNAQSFIPQDLRRIASNELQHALDEKTSVQRAGGTGTGRRTRRSAGK